MKYGANGGFYTRGPELAKLLMAAAPESYAMGFIACMRRLFLFRWRQEVGGVSELIFENQLNPCPAAGRFKSRSKTRLILGKQRR